MDFCQEKMRKNHFLFARLLQESEGLSKLRASRGMNESHLIPTSTSLAATLLEPSPPLWLGVEGLTCWLTSRLLLPQGRRAPITLSSQEVDLERSDTSF